ncbi:peptidase S53 [Acidovorax sp. SUPP2539]|uniref:peptidase S53 n=1 Tax=Acidovorax sp. SUPP2539 TaxID=2920878 RepID=UPI0023DE1DD0|nr:peptidase S53 [Acidovorax sp. SUPP2539]GKS90690.1 S53 family peptidase [Acidovorax sp. SUPP2539]
MPRPAPSLPARCHPGSPLWPLAALAAAFLASCGGGSTTDGAATRDGEAAASVTTLSSSSADLPTAVPAELTARPAFHIAPVLLPDPGPEDAADPTASASMAPRSTAIDAGLATLSTRHLTPDRIKAAIAQEQQAPSADGTGEARAASVVTTYTPAQVRAAYGLPALPASGATPNAQQAAQMGAGQTIYIVAARHNPNAAAELATFNQKFGLPACTAKVLPASTALPLPAPAATAGCELWQAYATSAGGPTGTAPAYDAGWATEIALDLQWSHAIAPAARIVLIEAPDASVGALTAAVRLANAMGPGQVSMSFGAPEGSWGGGLESAFAGTRMGYLAATGDSGAGVMWPAASPGVLGVGGTSLTYTGAGVRSEVAWSGTGGGTSAYFATPAYQQSGLPGVGSVARRTVADVAMNADPSTGQYVAVMPQGGGAAQWLSAGGTSLSTPMWSGLMAVAGALRAQAGGDALGRPHAALYGTVGAQPASYAAGFLDVAAGSHGTCATCTARSGYDQLTGLGTPRAADLLGRLAGSTVAAPPPVVGSAAVSGLAGQPLSFTVSVASANAVSLSLAGAPAGMAVSGTGVVTWAAPVAGSYAVTVTARDTKTGLSGQGTYTVTITAPLPPSVPGGSISGTEGVPLAFSGAATSVNPLRYALSGAPSGMAIGADGSVTWARPVQGTYAVTVAATDTKTGLTGRGTYSVRIAAAGSSTPPGGLSVAAAPWTGTAGKALTGTITVSAPGASWLSVTITGAPLGMGFSIQGTTVTARWPSPVAGSYALTIVARDSLGRTAQATVPVSIR